MRVFLVSSLVAGLMIISGCRSDSDVIAEMKSGVITRLEFNQWLKSRGVNPDSLNGNTGELEKYLRQLGIEKLAVEEAITDRFDRTTFYKTVNRAVYSNYLASYYISEIKKNIKFNERSAELNLIRLYLPAKEKGVSFNEVRNDKLTLAKYIISQYRCGESFEELAKRYSEDIKGSSGVFPVVTMEKEFFEKIKYLQKGECSDNPIVFDDSILIVKLVRWLNINNENAEKMISDKDRYEKFIEQISEDAVEYIISEKGSNLVVNSNVDKTRLTGRNQIIFSIDGDSFTSGDMVDLIELFLFLKTESGEDITNNNIDKKNLTLTMYRESLLSHIAEKEGLGRNDDFLKKWGYIKRSILAGAYKYKLLSVVDNKSDIISMKSAVENRLLLSGGFKIHGELLY